MRIVHVVPGSGTAFYCENCLRDTALVKAQRALGHTVITAPLYLPLFTDEPQHAHDAPVFYGAINVYLREKLPLYARLPRRLTHLLDALPLLRWAASKAGSTRPESLEDMFISMLRGEHGRQASELDRLILWLRTHAKPDIVHLSNALLLGLAPRITRDVGVPVVCSLQDEDGWIDSMQPDAAGRAWALMRSLATHVAAFAPVSDYYREFMRTRLNLPATQLCTIPIGLALDDYAPSSLPFDPPVIGFLSRLCSSFGLDTLVEAFIRLKRTERLRNLRLHATGGRTSDDARFLRRLQRRLRICGLENDVRVYDDFSHAQRRRFLQELTVLCVPARHAEAFGVFQLEALAAGVPVVVPHLGAFPEIIAATGGGLTYPGGDDAALDAALSSLLLDPVRTRAMAAHGHAIATSHYNVEQMARASVALYERCIGDHT
jgi:glycosyltransferase involved in cell wall biosynthesis